MRPKKIFILLGHPDTESWNSRFASAYEKGARDAGHEVRRVNLGELDFDPILHNGYKVIQELEPDLKKVQEDIKWADHFVLFYPTWWVAMPALLKGFFDRAWLPGFAFKFRPNGIGWWKLMKGKTARVFVTMDSPYILERVLFGDFTNEIKKGLLGFAGFKVKIKKLSGMKFKNEAKKERMKKWLAKWGKKGK
ncbi:MAG: NAD(P)H-dependent oxidoreductase [bacterium]|nr:NAD(P)H-dependent oxidoreductase [bacterium]